MPRRVRCLLVDVAALFVLPLLVLFYASGARGTIVKDARHWGKVLGEPRRPAIWALLRLLAEHRTFRNLFYYRVARSHWTLAILALPFKLLFHEQPTLSISARGSIGAGLFVQHGFSTVIAAESIGERCFVNQQVTIGYVRRTDCPTLGDDVTVTAGAKILGAVRVGDHCVVGANAVVLKDVPPNCVVVGVPARIVRRNGVRVDEPLI
jgi:serine O-acetyltransferase